MRDTKRKDLGRVGRTTYLLTLLVLTIWALTMWPGGDASAAAADESAADVIVDEIGPEWTRTLPDPEGLTPAGAARLFSSKDATLQLLANPRLDCATGVTGQSHGLALLRSVGFEELPADGSGVAKFTAGVGGASGLAAMFTTNRFTFVVFVFANDPAVALDPIADSVVALQAARDGGVVIEAGQATSRLDSIILDSPPLPGLGNQIDYTTDSFACEQGPQGIVATSEVLTFLSTHSTERLRGWLDLSTGSGAIVNLIDYPYEMFAGIAAGSPLPQGSRPLPVSDFDGLERVPDVTAWRTAGDVPQYFAIFRRGRILALVAVTEGTDAASARSILSTLSRAQFELLPNGSTTALQIPTAAESVTRSGSLIAVIGVAVLGVRRVRAGRVVRIKVKPDNAVSFDVSRRAAALRHRGALLGALQVVCIAAIVVFLSSDIGWLRAVGAAATVLLGIGVTVLWRRKESRVLGVASMERVHPRPSPGSAALTVLALSLLAGGAGLVVWGLRETLFVPSLTHLQLSDRLSIEPRLLAWMIAAIGLLVIVIDAFVLRAARALARIGWREWTDAAPPIVYLRSFEDDDVQLANVLSARRPFLEFFTLRGRDAFEESVAWELACYGPVLAIARPGHSDVSLGAARMHLGDDEWRTVISEQIDEARAVAITIGRTPGLAWEISHIVQTGHLDKTVLLVPPVDVAEVELRLKFIADTLALAGVDPHSLQVDPNGLVVVKVGHGDQPAEAYCADRRDEATYRAAVAAVLA